MNSLAIPAQTNNLIIVSQSNTALPKSKGNGLVLE